MSKARLKGPSHEDPGLVGGSTEKVHDTDFMLWIWKFLRGVAAKLPYLLDHGLFATAMAGGTEAFAGQIDGVPAKERHDRRPLCPAAWQPGLDGPRAGRRLGRLGPGSGLRARPS
jgi:hypothetical protein